MSKETIELLKILKDETQSRSVFDRCEAEIKYIVSGDKARAENPMMVVHSTNAKAWETTVAGRAVGETPQWTPEELAKIAMRAKFEKLHINRLPKFIRDGEEVRIK